jgi:hypothetical protein
MVPWCFTFAGNGLGRLSFRGMALGKSTENGLAASSEISFFSFHKRARFRFLEDDVAKDRENKDCRLCKKEIKHQAQPTSISTKVAGDVNVDRAPLLLFCWDVLEEGQHCRSKDRMNKRTWGLEFFRFLRVDVAFVTPLTLPPFDDGLTARDDVCWTVSGNTI